MEKKTKVEFEFVPLDQRLKKSLLDAQKTAEDTEKSVNKSAGAIQGLFQAIGGAVVFTKIKGFFSEAFESAKKLEASLARVESAARAMGQGTNAAKNAAMELTKDGFLNLNQAAGSLSNLMQSGLNLDQSVKFVEAAKNVSAFNNTIGNASQAVEDLTAGIIKNSAEVIENASPTLKRINQEYQALITTQGKAAAVQFLYNAMLKEGNKFAGDAVRYLDTAAAAEKRFSAATEAASAAIGKGLSPALKVLYDILGSVVTGFTTWYSNLSTGAKTIIGLTGLLLGLIPAIGAVIPILNVLGFTFAKTWTAALGPIGLIIAALGALAVAANAVYDAYKKGRGEELVEKKKSVLEEVEALALNKKNVNALNDAKKRLKEINNELSASYDGLLKKYNLENAAFETKLNFIRRIDQAEKNLGGNERIKGWSDKEVADKINELRGAQRAARTNPSRILSADDRRTMEINTNAEIDLLLNEQERRKKEPKSKAPVEGGAKGVETRFIEAQKQLLEIEKNRVFTIASISRRLNEEERARQKQNAEDDAKQAALNAIGAYRVAYAEYAEDRLMVDIENNEKAARDAVRASIEVLNAELAQAKGNEEKIAKAKEDNEARLYKIRQAYFKKNADAYASSLIDTLNTGKAMAESIAKIRSGDTGGGVAGLLSSGGKLGQDAVGQLKKYGVLSKDSFAGEIFGMAGTFGGVVGAVTSLGSAIGGLFGKSDEERAREAKEQARRDEEAKAILELQANYQKSMLALQEAAAKLPFENLQRNLRLIEIEAQQQRLSGVDEETVESQRLAKRQQTLQSTLTSESGAIGRGTLFTGQGSSPQELIAMLSGAAALKNQISPLVGLANASGSVDLWTMIQMVAAEMQRLGFTDVKAVERQNGSGTYRTLDYGRFESSISNGQIIEPTLTTDLEKLAYRAMQQAFGGQYGWKPLDPLLSEMTTDIGIADNLLSTIEQSNQVQLEIAANTKKTADNTSLQLEKDRAAAFIDIAGGGIRGFGQLLTGQYGLNTNALTLPQGLSNAILATQGMKTLEEKSFDALKSILGVNEDMRELLAEIAVNTNRAAGAEVVGSRSETELLQMLDAFKARS